MIEHFKCGPMFGNYSILVNIKCKSPTNSIAPLLITSKLTCVPKRGLEPFKRLDTF